MRTSILILCVAAMLLPLVAGLSRASGPEMWLPGPGGNPADIDREVLWLDNPDFADLVGPSEVIGAYGLEAEIANDLFLEMDATIKKVTWWGTYWEDFNGTPTGAGFNLRFYYDTGDCLPEDDPFIEYLLPGDDCSEALAEGGDQFSQFVYEYCLDLPLPAGRYWFSVQMADHEFPPRWGRQGAGLPIQHCDSVYRSLYFSYPEWTPTGSILWYPWDASQMFEDMCDDPTAIENATWGRVKGLFR